MTAHTPFAVIVKRGRYFVVKAGEIVHGPSHRKDKAFDAKKRLEREAGMRSRTCLTCSTRFDSEGPHHRMCQSCRRRSVYDGAA